MKPLSYVPSAIAVAALAFAGCSGGSSSTLPHAPVQASPAAAATAAPAAAQGATTFAYGAEALRTAHYGGPAKLGSFSIDVALQPQNASGLVAYAKAVNDPKNAQYRKFLTPAEIGTRFGASAASIASTAKYFETYGLHVGTWPQHLSLYVSGSQHAFERAFGTTLGIYTAGKSTFVGPVSTPHFAASLPVTSVTHLVSAARQFRTFVPGSGVVTSGYAPQQIRNAFDYSGAYNASYTGTGIDVGIVGTGPISAADVPAYGSIFSTNVAPVTQVNVTDQGVAAPGIEQPPDTGFQSPPPVTAPCGNGLLPPACNAEDVEAQLDTEQVASLAPGSNVLFYLGYAPGYCIDDNGDLSQAPCADGTTPFPLIGIDVSDDEIQQAIADDKADVLSISYGGPEQANAGFEFDGSNPTSGLGPMEFAALAAEGVAVFVSSGDSGAEGCQSPEYDPALDDACVSYPATDPNVTSVGGVNAPLDQFGKLTNQLTGWGYATQQGGSGGGVSQYFPQTLTPWQAGIPGVIGTTRNQPDVSLLGDPTTGAAVVVNAAFTEQVGAIGGTSVAAPQMAAMWALVLQACAASASCATAQGAKPYRLGNAAPLLYAQYASGATIVPAYASTFYDVLYGDNQQPSTTGTGLDPGYNAGPGYDRVTGIGVPFARSLIRAVTKQ